MFPTQSKTKIIILATFNCICFEFGKVLKTAVGKELDLKIGDHIG